MLQTKCTQAFSPYLSPLQSAGLSAGTTAARRTCGDRFVKFIRYVLAGSTELLAGPRTCHARSRLTTKLSPGSFAKSPLQANRLLETAAFTNPTSQILPLAKQPDQTISKLDQSISNPTKPSATRQTISSQISPSATRPNHQQARPVHQHDPEAKKLSTGQRTVSSTTTLPATRPTSNRTENHQPTREPPHRPKNHQPAKPPYFRALPSLKALPTLAPRGR